MKKYVLICCQRCDYNDDILLVLKDKPEWQKGRWNLPGGKIEENESPDEAAIRELREETGYQPMSPIRMMGTLVGEGCEIYCYKAIVPSNLKINPRVEETQDVFWERWYQARRDFRLIPNLTLIIPLIRCGVQGWRIQDQYESEGKSLHGVYVELPCEKNSSNEENTGSQV